MSPAFLLGNTNYRIAREGEQRYRALPKSWDPRDHSLLHVFRVFDWRSASYVNGRSCST